MVEETLQEQIVEDDILQKMSELSYYQGKDGLYTTLIYNDKKRSVLVGGQEYINYITTRIFRESGDFVSEKDIKDRLKIISCELIEQNVCETLFPKRYAYDNGIIFINMANDQLQYIEVNEEGYETVDCYDDTPLFVKNLMEQPMVSPISSSENSLLLTELDDLLNLSDSDKFIFKIWLIASMNPSINVPILYLLGNAGTGKSTMQKLIADLVDPSTRGLVNWDGISNKEMAISLDHSYVINFDNVSHITAKKSDMLCQGVTGGKFTARKLYSDSDELSYNLQTRVTISSVEDCILRSDLASRTLFLTVPKFENKARIREDEFISKYENDKPQILGQMLNILSVALARYSEWQEEHYSSHRLASFDLFGSLIADIMDEENGYEYFKKIMREKRIHQIFRCDDDYVFMTCLFDTLDEVFDNHYKGMTKRLYDSIIDWITDSPNTIYDGDVTVNYDRFAKMLRNYEDDFPILGYKIRFYRLKKENVSGVEIEKIQDDNFI